MIASREKNDDLFYGISGSYGTLGLLTLIKLRLREAKPYVRLVYEPLASHADCLRVMKERCADPAVDYVEAVLTDPSHGVVISGALTDEQGDLAVREYTNASDEWFYMKVEEVVRRDELNYELVPIRDYLFRYNRGAFWMGEYVLTVLHVPHYKLFKFFLNPWMNTKKCYDALHDTNISQEYFIQDFYVPFEKASQFLSYSDEKLGVYPIWLCPMKPTKNAQKLSPHFSTANVLLDIGIYGQSDKYLKDPVGMNLAFEEHAQSIGARKMLYAHAYYSLEDFWKIYEHTWYVELRKKYHAIPGFPEIWDKVHVTPHKFDPHLFRGMLKLLLETLEGKNLNA